MNVNSLDDPDRISRLFGSYYYAHDCGLPYQRNDHWLGFFDSIAERIVTDIGPGTVLDAGCAWGFLVECLRKRGVEAWGVDISPYAIEQVHPDIRQFCQVGSLAEPLPDPLPKEYDLVVTIEVLEHMPEEEGKRAVELVCRSAKDVLCSASYQDYRESTHLNVQPPDYWVQQFARHGFYRDIDFDASFITPWTNRFRKGVEPLHQVVRGYERRLWSLQTEVRELRNANLEMMEKLQVLSQKLEERETLLASQSQTDMQLMQLKAQVQALEGELSAWQARWADAQQGAGWRILEAFRRFRLKLFPAGSRREKWFYNLIHPKR